MEPVTLQLAAADRMPACGHPWLAAQALAGAVSVPERSDACHLLAADGRSLGCGLLDQRDPQAAWRRFSWADDARFDEDYIAHALQDAIQRRADEPCRRLVSADADYLPGLVIEQYGDLFTLAVTHRAVEPHVPMIVDLLKEMFALQEVVLLNDAPVRDRLGLERYRRTASGQNVKARWVPVDGLDVRIDPLNANKAGVYLDQREQQALVGSLCAGRRVLDGFAHSGAFALQALRAGAEMAVAVDSNEHFAKGIGATAQKNGCALEALHADMDLVLDRCDPGAFDAIILDPPEALAADPVALQRMHRKAFAILDAGGLLATYCRSTDLDTAAFDRMVADAAAASGREGRIFARISQPFDFPVLLNLPESRLLQGLILQVE